MQIECLKCKGRGFCGRNFCPIYAKAESMFKVKERLSKEDFFGASPAPFIGRFGYPRINVGILVPPEVKDEAWLYDAPAYWSDNEFQIPQLIDIRSSLVNSRFKADIKDHSKMLEISQEVGMASKPVELEISLDKKPRFLLNQQPDVAPMGPNANIKKVAITSNPKISSHVEKVVDDTDFKANDAILYLYDHGFDENFLSKLMSVGNIGVKTDRKLVPTRFSITAVDDNIGKNLINQIKDFSFSNYLAYFGGYLGNYYLIMFFPEIWSYELFETYLPKASWNISTEIQYMTDYESYDGRKDYAENCTGGYYSNRLPILEKLGQLKRQASVLSLRFITGEYSVPLGVWVVREATRKALKRTPLEFSDKELMLKYSRSLILKKFGHDISPLLDKSILLNSIKTQKKLNSFI
jgi:hypothetical protein